MLYPSPLQVCAQVSPCQFHRCFSIEQETLQTFPGVHEAHLRISNSSHQVHALTVRFRAYILFQSPQATSILNCRCSYCDPELLVFVDQHLRVVIKSYLSLSHIQLREVYIKVRAQSISLSFDQLNLPMLICSH